MARLANLIFGLLALAIGLALLGGGLVAILNAMTGGRADAAAQAGAALIPLLMGAALAAAGRRMVWPRREGASVPRPPAGNALRTGAVLLVVLGLIVGAGYWFRSANDDLIELAKRREADLTRLRPVLLKYRDEKGAFPTSLDELVPSHVPAIPESLRNAPGAENAFKVSYQSDGRNALAVYRGHRGPDSRRTFDIETGRVSVDP